MGRVWGGGGVWGGASGDDDVLTTRHFWGRFQVGGACFLTASRWGGYWEAQRERSGGKYCGGLGREDRGRERCAYKS